MPPPPYGDILLYCHHKDWIKNPFFTSKYEQIKREFPDKFFKVPLSDNNRLSRFTLEFPGEPKTECSVFSKVEYGVDAKYCEEVVRSLNREHNIISSPDSYSILVKKYFGKIALGFNLKQNKSDWTKRTHAGRLPAEPKLTSDDGITDADQPNYFTPVSRTTPLTVVPVQEVTKALTTVTTLLSSGGTAVPTFPQQNSPSVTERIIPTKLSASKKNNSLPTNQSKTITTKPSTNASFSNFVSQNTCGVKTSQSSYVPNRKRQKVEASQTRQQNLQKTAGQLSVLNVSTSSQVLAKKSTKKNLPSTLKTKPISDPSLPTPAFTLADISASLGLIVQKLECIEVEMKVLKTSQQSMDRRQRSGHNATKEIGEEVKQIKDALRNQTSLITRVMGKNVSNIDTIMQTLPFNEELVFEVFFEIEENRNLLSDFICSNVPASEDFTSQVFNKIFTHQLMAKYTWPSTRGNNFKGKRNDFPSKFVCWFESLTTEALQGQYWFNPTKNVRKLRKLLTNVRYGLHQMVDNKQPKSPHFSHPTSSTPDQTVQDPKPIYDDMVSVDSFQFVDVELPNLTESETDCLDLSFHDQTPFSSKSSFYSDISDD